MAEYSFLEISYDPSVVPTEVVKTNLNKIGFIHRTQHKLGLTGFCNLHKCIKLNCILLKCISESIIKCFLTKRCILLFKKFGLWDHYRVYRFSEV